MAQSASNERKWIWLLCLIAAVHVFIFSAVFPFFNVMDEQVHFDLAVRYSHGEIPRTMAAPCDEVLPFIAIYGTSEYLWTPESQPGGKFAPPPWTQPMSEVGPKLLQKETNWKNGVINYEVAQPPLYYALAGVWWDLGKLLGFHDGHLLYWLRFLNAVIVAAIVWLGWFTARMIFPENLFLRLGVPVLIAFLPQTSFYSIQNDTLSPLCFGAAFVLLLKWLQADAPNVRLGIAIGLALAATYLAKISNVPLLGASAAVVLWQLWRLKQAGKLRGALPSLAALGLCAALPVAAWLAWCKINFGDFTGTAAKVQFLGWTHKSFAEWWSHPIFTPHGLWTFVSGLMATFWQGEMMWHRLPLTLPVVDLLYAILSVGLIAVALVALLPRFKAATGLQRQALWFGCFSLLAVAVFLGFLSIIYDFQDCFYPSRVHPYFTSGRLMLGALIPFMLLFVFGLDRVLNRYGGRVKFLALCAMVVFMLAAEITVDWRIFPNAYNWFHL
jgi:hypothetical protein